MRITPAARTPSAPTTATAKQEPKAKTVKSTTDHALKIPAKQAHVPIQKTGLFVIVQKTKQVS